MRKITKVERRRKPAPAAGGGCDGNSSTEETTSSLSTPLKMKQIVIYPEKASSRAAGNNNNNNSNNRSSSSSSKNKNEKKRGSKEHGTCASSSSSSSSTFTGSRTLPPLWRLNPKESCSDLTIHIEGNDLGGKEQRRGGVGDRRSGSACKRQTYHVHKIHLVLGEHRSRLIESILRGKDDEEEEEEEELVNGRGGRGSWHGKKKTERRKPYLAKCRREIRILVTDGAAARAFPLFLDALYTGGKIFRNGGAGCGIGAEEGVLSAPMAVAVLHLLEYFQVSSPSRLIHYIENYLMSNVSPDDGSLVKCLPLILKYQSDEYMKVPYLLAQNLAVEAVLTRHPHLRELFAGGDSGGEDGDDSDNSHSCDVPFIAGVFATCRKLVRGRSLVVDDAGETEADFSPMSVAAAYFLDAHQDVISRRELEEITAEENMPVIASEVALKLLEVESKIRINTGTAGQKKLSSLQRRCVEALARNEIDDPIAAAETVDHFSGRQLFEFVDAWLQLHRKDGEETVAANNNSHRNGEGPRHYINILSIYEDLNGSYRQIPGSDGREGSSSSSGTQLPSYSKRGEWLGKPATFRIWKKEGEEWCIGYTYDAGEGNVRLLATNYQESDTPPAWGWRNTKRICNFPIFLAFCKCGN